VGGNFSYPIYNLAFGNLTKGGGMDGITVSDNKDRNKILATIAFAVYDFTESKHGVTLFFTGSTPERTRLYRMAISLNFNELRKEFEVYGLVKDATGYIEIEFIKEVDFFAFFFKTKND
jgi:hypothetical protein